MNKKCLLIMLLSLVMVIGAGCGEKPPNASKGAPSESSNNSPNPEESGQSQVILVYYTDEQVEQLIEKEANITFTDEIEKYQQTFAALQMSNESDLVSLWAKVQLNSLAFDSGVLTLDVHIPDEARLGSGGEQFALQALTDTFWQFEEITAIDILVDGEMQESLMGHVDLEHPIVRDNGSAQ